MHFLKYQKYNDGLDILLVLPNVEDYVLLFLISLIKRKHQQKHIASKLTALATTHVQRLSELSVEKGVDLRMFFWHAVNPSCWIPTSTTNIGSTTGNIRWQTELRSVHKTSGR